MSNKNAANAAFFIAQGMCNELRSSPCFPRRDEYNK